MRYYLLAWLERNGFQLRWPVICVLFHDWIGRVMSPRPMLRASEAIMAVVIQQHY